MPLRKEYVARDQINEIQFELFPLIDFLFTLNTKNTIYPNTFIFFLNKITQDMRIISVKQKLY